MAIESPVPASGVTPQRISVLSRHIEDVYKSAPVQTHIAGKLWYPRAQKIAEEVGATARKATGDQSLDDVTRGAGIIAALSPQMSWERNIDIAHEVARTGHTSQSTTLFRRRARDIREGAHPEEVLKPAGSSAHKTFSFFHNIQDPDDPNYVTIDRHAHDLAVGQKFGDHMDRGLSAAGRYGAFEEAYKKASHRLGVEHPSSVQAATWLHWTGRPE